MAESDCGDIYRPAPAPPPQVPAIRMVNEARLAALAVELSTGLLVDIGESGFTITPIFDGCPVAPGVRSESCGGRDVTRFLDCMLLSRTNEQYNQMVRSVYTRSSLHSSSLRVVGVLFLPQCIREGGHPCPSTYRSYK